MAEDSKFEFVDGKFRNRVSGEPIPDDEPVMIFRARDVHAVEMLEYYWKLCRDPHHKQAVQDKIDEFHAYMVATPWAMKEPGITHHVKLKGEE